MNPDFLHRRQHPVMHIPCKYCRSLRAGFPVQRIAKALRCMIQAVCFPAQGRKLIPAALKDTPGSTDLLHGSRNITCKTNDRIVTLALLLVSSKRCEVSLYVIYCCSAGG